MVTTETRHQSADHLKTLPRNNPCAQCGTPIQIPEWVEHDQRRVAYLWHCYACDYQFEAIAYFHNGDENQAIAA